MNKTLFALMMVVATLLPHHLYAQKQARELFVSMPDSLLPYLTAVNRADCIDFLDSKMRARITNRFGQETEMAELAADYIKMRLSPEATWQMKLLPVNDSTQVVCVVRTLCATACDSDIRFYSTSWEELTTSDYLSPLPDIADFFKSEVADNEALVPTIAAFDIRLLKLDLTASDTALLIDFSTADYVTPNVLTLAEPYIVRTIKYEWRDGRFQR